MYIEKKISIQTLWMFNTFKNNQPVYIDTLQNIHDKTE